MDSGQVEIPHLAVDGSGGTVYEIQHTSNWLKLLIYSQ